jgi:hypothetical protein
MRRSYTSFGVRLVVCLVGVSGSACFIDPNFLRPTPPPYGYGPRLVRPPQAIGDSRPQAVPVPAVSPRQPQVLLARPEQTAMSPAALPAATESPSQTPDVRIENRTGADICHLYIQATNSTESVEVLQGYVMSDGTEITASLPDASLQWNVTGLDCQANAVAVLNGASAISVGPWVLTFSGEGSVLPTDAFWVAADAQIENFAGVAFIGQGALADGSVSGDVCPWGWCLSLPGAVRPPAAVLGAQAVLRRAAWFIAADPATTVFLGDAGHVGCRQEVDAVFHRFDSALQSTPWVFVPGNHDCFPMGAMAPEGHPQFDEWYPDMASRWTQACENASDPDAGAANKFWLVDRVASHFDAAMARQPEDSRSYWRYETRPSTLTPASGAVEPWEQHKAAWIVQVFPLGQPSIGGEGSVRLVVALDTTDWSEPGVSINWSPGSEGCVSTVQAEAAVRLVREIRGQEPEREFSIVLVGHHPMEDLTQCHPQVGSLMRDLGTAAYVAAHKHAALGPIVDPPAIQEFVVGSVVEHGDQGAEPEVERFTVGNGTLSTARYGVVSTVLSSSASGAAPLCCDPVWGVAASAPETRADYRHGLRTARSRSIWLELSLSHLREAGRWCNNAGATGRCAALSDACADVYELSDQVFDRLAHSSWWENLGGSRTWTWNTVSENLGLDGGLFLGCLRDGLGLGGDSPDEVDPVLEQYVVCTALRASKRESSPRQATAQDQELTYRASACAGGGDSGVCCLDQASLDDIVIRSVSAAISPLRSDGELWDDVPFATDPDIKGSIEAGCTEPPGGCVASQVLGDRPENLAPVWDLALPALLWRGASVRVRIIDGDIGGDDLIDDVRFYYDGPREYVVSSPGSLRRLTVKVERRDPRQLPVASVRNGSSVRTCFVFASPCSSDEWGEDRLGRDRVLDPGQVLRVAL